MSIDYTVIASGSRGNAVLIEDVLVDIGVPFKALKEYLYNVKYIIIKHIHSDHLRLATYKKIKQLFPNIVFIANWEVASKVEIDYLVNAGYPLTVGEYTFAPFELIHDVLCYGYTWEVNDKRIIYATDTHSLKNAPDAKYDYMFLESNYDPNKIKMVKPTRGYDARLSALRHLSTFDSKQFYYTHRRDENSEWIELHKSSRFY